MSRDLLTPLGVSVLGPEVASAFDKIQRTLSRDALKIIEQMRDRLGVRPAGAKLQASRREHLPKILSACERPHLEGVRVSSTLRMRSTAKMRTASRQMAVAD